MCAHSIDARPNPAAVVSTFSDLATNGAAAAARKAIPAAMARAVASEMAQLQVRWTLRQISENSAVLRLHNVSAMERSVCLTSLHPVEPRTIAELVARPKRAL